LGAFWIYPKDLLEVEELKTTDLEYGEMRVKINDILSFHFEMSFDTFSLTKLRQVYTISQIHNIPCYIWKKPGSYSSLDWDA